MKDQIVEVIGLGYIGLPTALMFAETGYKVIGVEKKQLLLRELKQGNLERKEKGIQDLLHKHLNNGRLSLERGCQEADIFIITVPTPLTDEKVSDMSLVIEATKEIIPYLRKGGSVIIESTCKVGTVERDVEPIIEQTGLKVGRDIHLGYCPERVMPGNILEEIQVNNRVIGSKSKESAKYIGEIYKSFVKGEILLTDIRTAEMCKLVENTFRDVNIAFANELLKVCENMALDVWEVISLCNRHPRVNILNPGAGVGGHCLAVDPYFLIEACPQEAAMMRQARTTNENMPRYVCEKIEELMEYTYNKQNVVILGATYKPNCEDTRESPILEVDKLLREKGYTTKIIDPYIDKIQNLEQEIIKQCQEADLLIVGVGHEVFKTIDIRKIQMRQSNILDLTGIWKEKTNEWEKFSYYLLGGKNIK